MSIFRWWASEIDTLKARIKDLEAELKQSELAYQNGRADGLEKAAEIAQEESEKIGRISAYKTFCRDISIICLATAARVRRGEYENSTSDVMGSKKEDTYVISGPITYLTQNAICTVCGIVLYHHTVSDHSFTIQPVKKVVDSCGCFKGGGPGSFTYTCPHGNTL